MKKNKTEDAVVVVLVDAGTQKISVIKTVRELTGLGLKEAKDLVDAVASVPQQVGGRVSVKKANEIRAAFEVVGAVAKVVSTENSRNGKAALTEALEKCEEERIAAQKKEQRAQARAAKKAAQEQERREAVLYLLHDKIRSKIQAFASDLDKELEWFKGELIDSGTDVAAIPGTAVQIEDSPQGPGLSFVVSFK